MDTIKTTKTALAKKLGIARSSLYYQPKKPVQNEKMKSKIIVVMSEHAAYGHRRVGYALGMNHKKIQRIMKLYGLKPQVRRGIRPNKVGDRNRQETRVKNILNVLCPIQSTVVWAGDFTYFWFIDRFWYVATVIDIHTREIVGWHIANHHTISLIMDAFNDAVRRTSNAPQYFHSDQGSEYTSGAYKSLLNMYGTTQSHSNKSSPWQNGYQESFYSNFKLELGNINQFEHVGKLIEAINLQIAYYNNIRIHGALRMSPIQFKQKQAIRVAC